MRYPKPRWVFDGEYKFASIDGRKRLKKKRKRFKKKTSRRIAILKQKTAYMRRENKWFSKRLIYKHVRHRKSYKRISKLLRTWSVYSYDKTLQKPLKTKTFKRFQRLNNRYKHNMLWGYTTNTPYSYWHNKLEGIGVKLRISKKKRKRKIRRRNKHLLYKSFSGNNFLIAGKSEYPTRDDFGFVVAKNKLGPFRALLQYRHIYKAYKKTRIPRSRAANKLHRKWLFLHNVLWQQRQKINKNMPARMISWKEQQGAKIPNHTKLDIVHDKGVVWYNKSIKYIKETKFPYTQNTVWGDYMRKKQDYIKFRCGSRDTKFIYNRKYIYNHKTFKPIINRLFKHTYRFIRLSSEYLISSVVERIKTTISTPTTIPVNELSSREKSLKIAFRDVTWKGSNFITKQQQIVKFKFINPKPKIKDLEELVNMKKRGIMLKRKFSRQIFKRQRDKRKQIKKSYFLTNLERVKHKYHRKELEWYKKHVQILKNKQSFLSKWDFHNVFISTWKDWWWVPSSVKTPLQDYKIKLLKVIRSLTFYTKQVNLIQNTVKSFIVSWYDNWKQKEYKGTITAATPLKSLMEVEEDSCSILLENQKLLKKKYELTLSNINCGSNVFSNTVKLKSLKRSLEANYYLLSTNLYYRKVRKSYYWFKILQLKSIYMQYGPDSHIFKTYLGNLRRIDEPPYEDVYWITLKKKIHQIYNYKKVLAEKKKLSKKKMEQLRTRVKPKIKKRKLFSKRKLKVKRKYPDKDMFKERVLSHIDLRKLENSHFLTNIPMDDVTKESLLKHKQQDLVKSKSWCRKPSKKRVKSFLKLLKKETSVIYWKNQTELRIIAQSSLTENIKTQMQNKYENLYFKSKPINPTIKLSEIQDELNRRCRIRKEKTKLLKKIKDIAIKSERAYLSGYANVQIGDLLNTKSAQRHRFNLVRYRVATKVFNKLLKEYAYIKKTKQKKLLKRWHYSWNNSIPVNTSEWLKTKQGQLWSKSFYDEYVVTLRDAFNRRKEEYNINYSNELRLAEKFSEYSDKELQKQLNGSILNKASVFDNSYQQELRSWLLDKYYYKYYPADLNIYKKTWDPRVVTHPVQDLRNAEIRDRWESYLKFKSVGQNQGLHNRDLWLYWLNAEPSKTNALNSIYNRPTEISPDLQKKLYNDQYKTDKQLEVPITWFSIIILHIKHLYYYHKKPKK